MAASLTTVSDTLLSTTAPNTYGGVKMVAAKGYGTWNFQVIGGASATSITVYGTLDPAAIGADGKANPNYPAPGAAGGNWFALNPGAVATAPADVSNPITKADGSNNLFYSGPLKAVCAVSGATQTGTSTVLGMARD